MQNVKSSVTNTGFSTLFVGDARDSLYKNLADGGLGIAVHEDFDVNQYELIDILHDGMEQARDSGTIIDIGPAKTERLMNMCNVSRTLSRSKMLHPPFANKPWMVVTIPYNDNRPNTLVTLLVPLKSAEDAFGPTPTEPIHNAVQMFNMIWNQENSLTVDDICILDFETGQAHTRLTWAEEHEDGMWTIHLFSLLAALGIMNTRGITWQKKPTKKTRKNKITQVGRKIPMTDYFTRLSSGAARSSGSGVGTHASPIPHLRRGHIRTYATGHTSWIRDCMVNVADANQPAFMERTGYKL